MQDCPSKRLASLLYASKRLECVSPRECVQAALGWCYTEHMSLTDCLHHVLQAWWEVRGDRRFEVGGANTVNAVQEVMLAPISGLTSIEMLGPKSLDKEYPVEAWYNAIMQRMLNDLAVARIDWCAGAVNTSGKEMAEWEARSKAVMKE